MNGMARPSRMVIILSLSVFSLMVCIFGVRVARHWHMLHIHSEAESKRPNISQSGPSVGSTIPLLRGQSVNDHEMTIDLARRETSTLLLALSPGCPHCRINFHNWREIVNLMKLDDVVWVDVTGTANADYLLSFGIPADACVIRLSQVDREADHLTSTPTTIWLDPHGVVRWAYVGELQSEEMEALRRLATLQSRTRPTNLRKHVASAAEGESSQLRYP
ncbi:MAG: hypothetical protein P4L50_30370 [Anaerolineaceae bacterium]|nr:hypothetical protein [Anaerolineaceae bacterium]